MSELLDIYVSMLTGSSSVADGDFICLVFS